MIERISSRMGLSLIIWNERNFFVRVTSSSDRLTVIWTTRHSSNFFNSFCARMRTCSFRSWWIGWHIVQECNWHDRPIVPWPKLKENIWFCPRKQKSNHLRTVRSLFSLHNSGAFFSSFVLSICPLSASAVAAKRACETVTLHKHPWCYC